MNILLAKRQPCFLLVLLGLTWLTTARAQDDPPLLRFYGRVLNDVGTPLPGLQVQFWHTDVNGNYDHPDDIRVDSPLLPDFQYFGTATTAAPDGNFTFVSFRPGIYGSRPTHIHFKVWDKKDDGTNTLLLTSQFYFADENVGVSNLLQLELVPQDGGFATYKDIVVVSRGDTGATATLPLTPSQQEGPFYPVVDFFGWDSDLTVVALADNPDANDGRVPVDTTTPVDTVAPSSAANFASVLMILPTLLLPTVLPLMQCCL